MFQAPPPSPSGLRLRATARPKQRFGSSGRDPRAGGPLRPETRITARGEMSGDPAGPMVREPLPGGNGNTRAPVGVSCPVPVLPGTERVDALTLFENDFSALMPVRGRTRSGHPEFGPSGPGQPRDVMPCPSRSSGGSRRNRRGSATRRPGAAEARTGAERRSRTPAAPARRRYAGRPLPGSSGRASRRN